MVASAIRHDLPFRYVEQDGARETMQYLHSIPLICENVAKADLIQMNSSEKEMVKSTLNVCYGGFV